MSFPIFPKINGTTIKKEKRAAFVLSIPNKTDVDMVAPDLEIPGNMAMACDTPTRTAFEKDTFLSVLFALSANKSKAAVTNNITPTNNTFPTKKAANCFSKSNPIKTAGIMEMMILQ